MAVQRGQAINFVGAGLPQGMTAAGTAVCANSAGGTNVWQINGLYFETYNDAQNDDIVFSLNAAGLVIPNDNTDNDGIEFTAGITSASRCAFTVGQYPFGVDIEFTIPDVSDYDVCAVGFRKAAAYAALASHAATITAYEDVALLNVNAGAIYTGVRLGAAAGTLTDTTDVVVDGGSHTLSVRVSTAGVCTFLIDGAAPTVNTNTVTLTAATVMVPFFRATKNAGAASDTPPILERFIARLYA